jgi:hypothetical protein
MRQEAIRFDRSECTSCEAFPQCQARVLVDLLMSHLVTIIDQKYGEMIDSANDVRESVIGLDIQGFDQSLAASKAAAMHMMSKASKTSEAINRLIDTGEDVHARTSSNPEIYDFELTRVSDTFRDSTSFINPDANMLRAAIDDLVGFKEMNKCLQN